MDMWLAFLKLLIVFPILIFLLIYALKWINKYVQPQYVNKNMQVIEQMKLSPKTTVSIVKVGTQYLVIGFNDEEIRVLTELSTEEVKKVENHQSLHKTPELFSNDVLSEMFKKMDRWWKREQKED